jgi:hypothetical protein
MKIRSLLSLVVLTSLIIGVFYASTRVRGAQQNTKHRTIARLPIERNEPLTIRDIKVNGTSISFNHKFVADDDWMKSLVVTVKNASSKRILFASIDLFFPRPQDSKDPPAIFDVFYGKWALQNRRPTDDEQLIGIAPGEIADIGLSVQKFVDLTSFLKSTNFPQSIEKVDLRFGSVIFEDDTMWTRGSYFRRDPNNSSSWIVINP